MVPAGLYDELAMNHFFKSILPIPLFLVVSVYLFSADTATDSATEPKKSELDQFIDGWSSEYKDLKTLEIHFQQTRKLKILKRPLKSTGIICMAEGQLLCTVKNSRGEVESILHISKKTLQLHYPKLKRLESFEVGTSRTPAMAFPIFGMDSSALTREFKISLESKDKEKRLVLIPKNPRALIDSMTLIFRDGEIREVEQREKNDNTTRMRIVKFIRNPKIKAADLELRVPAGTKRVKM